MGNGTARIRTALFIVAPALACGALHAQGAAALNPPVRFTATTANVSGAPDSIRIDVMRWSTDAERDKLMAAWNLKPAAETAGESGRGVSARGGNGGRGGGGRGGRGAAEPAAPQTPESALAAALQEAPTVGYLWSSEVAGYAIRYAGKIPGSERIVLITDRRLGAITGLWQPAAPTKPSAYDFSVIELRINAKGEGEGKISFTGAIAADSAAGIVGIADYPALPVVLTKLKAQKP